MNQKERCPAVLLPLIAILSLGIAASHALANTIELEPADTQLWLQYQRNQRINEKWSLVADTGYRKMWESPVGHDDWTRWHLRSAFFYKQNSRLDFELGSGLFYTDRPARHDLTEFRTWLGATVYWPDSPGRFRRFVLTHRVRAEQRFFRESGTGDWSFASRARYRMSTILALNRKDVEPGAFYTFLSAEVFANFDTESDQLFTDRNRFSAGLGWVTPSTWTLELRYTRQDVKDTVTGNFRVTDNIVEFRVKTYFKIRDLMKRH